MPNEGGREVSCADCGSAFQLSPEKEASYQAALQDSIQEILADPELGPEFLVHTAVAMKYVCGACRALDPAGIEVYVDLEAKP